MQVCIHMAHLQITQLRALASPPLTAGPPLTGHNRGVDILQPCRRSPLGQEAEGGGREVRRPHLICLPVPPGILSHEVARRYQDLIKNSGSLEGGRAGRPLARLSCSPGGIRRCDLCLVSVAGWTKSPRRCRARWACAWACRTPPGPLLASSRSRYRGAMSLVTSAMGHSVLLNHQTLSTVSFTLILCLFTHSIGTGSFAGLYQ